MLSTNSCISTGKKLGFKDPILWNLAFSGQAITTRCMHCFSLSHRSDNCELYSKSKPQLGRSDRPQPTGQGTRHKLIRHKLICFQWNENTSTTCPYPNYRFQHICYICAYDPTVTDVVHKALHCPKRHGLGASQTAPQSASKGYKAKPLMQV